MVFRRLVFPAARGDDRHAVLHLDRFRTVLDHGLEVAHEPVHLGHTAVEVHRDVFVGLDALPKLRQELAYVFAPPGAVEMEA